MKISVETLTAYVADGRLRVQKHPTAPLQIWNYTERAQHENLWDAVTEQCRGLITDLDGNVVARPFRKFFNLNTTHRPETLVENLPAEVPEITEKLDGSLGIICTWMGHTFCATRGSFISEQAEWATRWFIREKPGLYLNMMPRYTYLVEILYKENRIVVDYGEREECVLLAVIDNETGKEVDVVHEALRLGKGLPCGGLNYAGRYDAADLPIILKWIARLGPNEEGFVCKYSNGLRIKLKGAEYLRLHRLLTGCTARRIWEALASGQSLDDFLERVPDEFYNWVQDVRLRLLSEFNSQKVTAEFAWRCVRDLPTRKEQAQYLRENFPTAMPLVFSLLDNKPIDDMIWKRLRPEHEVPWKTRKEGSE